MARMIKFSLQMSWPILIALIAQTWYAATEFQIIKSDIDYLKDNSAKVEARVGNVEQRLWK